MRPIKFKMCFLAIILPMLRQNLFQMQNHTRSLQLKPFTQMKDNIIGKVLLLKKIILQKMGNDGGDIPGRRQLVKDRKKIQHRDVESAARARARFCALTNTKLHKPIVMCRLGYFYNYENLLEAMAKKQMPHRFAYIRSLNDIRKLQVQLAPQNGPNFIICPVTRLQFNGLNRFVALWSCGHILARKAFKQICGNRSVCVLCQIPFTSTDLIDLNLDSLRLQSLRKQILENKPIKQKLEVNEEERGRKIIKADVYISPLDRLGGQFRDVIRKRNNFKTLFTRNQHEQETKIKADLQKNMK